MKKIYILFITSFLISACGKDIDTENISGIDERLLNLEEISEDNKNIQTDDTSYDQNEFTEDDKKALELNNEEIIKTEIENNNKEVVKKVAKAEKNKIKDALQVTKKEIEEEETLKKIKKIVKLSPYEKSVVKAIRKTALTPEGHIIDEIKKNKPYAIILSSYAEISAENKKKYTNASLVFKTAIVNALREYYGK